MGSSASNQAIRFHVGTIISARYVLVMLTAAVSKLSFLQKPVQGFPGMRNHKRLIRLMVYPLRWVDACGIKITEVDLLAYLLANGRSEGDADAWTFHALFKCAQPFEMCRVREDSPWVTLEVFPLGEKIVAYMVTDSPYQGSMRPTQFGDMWRIENDFTAICYNRLQFVHSLRPDPHVVIHGGQEGKYMLIGALKRNNMYMP